MGKIVLGFCRLALIAACLGGCNRDTDSGAHNRGPGLPQGIESAVACTLNSPARQVGVGLDATSLPGPVLAALSPSQGRCAGRGDYQFGKGLHDVTGVIADTFGPGWANPQQVFSALHTRLYARAFAIYSPCNNKRAVFVSSDIGSIPPSVRNAVLSNIAADPELSSFYNGGNIMLSATHTHSEPHIGLFRSNNGLAVIAGGIVAAIRKAHADMQSSGTLGHLEMAQGELLNTNINRSKPAYMNNPKAERSAYLNQRGEEVQVDKEMVQLEFYRQGQLRGLINWFGVHPTVIGPTQDYVSGDVKGEASLGYEALMGTDYTAETGTFVAAFAQGVEGDASPNIFIEQFPHPDPRRGGGVNDLDSNAISALKQLARALELTGTGEQIKGPVDYRLMWVNIDNIRIEDPAVLNALQHPADLDVEDKRTCTGVYGASFGAGAEDGPGPSVEGLTCDDELDVLAAAREDIATAGGVTFDGFPGGWPAETLPGKLLSAAAMCNIALLPPLLGDFSCQAEKPVLLPTGESELPFQLLRIGQLAILGLPWEISTTSSRRIRALLMQELAPAGIHKLLIASLVNDAAGYLTTREEYATQQYEGASTLYGPWTLAAVQQESLKLARAMRSGDELIDLRDPGPPSDLSLIAGPLEAPHPSGVPGTILQQPRSEAGPGETLEFSIVAGHPANDLRLQQSYVYIEREIATGTWQLVETDRAPSVIYRWVPGVESVVGFEQPLVTWGEGLAQWHIPNNIQPGRYRFRIAGASRSAGLEAVSYEAVSSVISLTGGADGCP